MANVARPRLPERRTRLTLSPALATEDVSINARRSSNSPISTRRTSKGNTLLALPDGDKPVKPIAHAPSPAAPAARTNSRKRSATALADATSPDTRPPTKIAVTHPHGELLSITNGVSAPLGIDAEDVPSARSTPRPGSAGKLAPAASGASATDKRSLRSHDGGSRLKSDLATYFSSYDDIISGVPKPDGMLRGCE
jgi:hypothetical protein